MTNEEAFRAYGLPSLATEEELEVRWSRVLIFGDKLLLAGYRYSGRKKPCYFGAVYKHIDDETMELIAASEVEFEDEGHAMAWGMQQ